MAVLLSWALPIAQTGPSPTPYLIGTVVGLFIGVAGHVVRSNLLIATGIIIIGVSTAVFAFQGPPS
ncbi:MAG TPA: hypothetical protein VGY97_01100 [Solirubrobacteraceae bacterium]|nr:hypothetical protein [Solirubrobacteraceae bacterium]